MYERFIAEFQLKKQDKIFDNKDTVSKLISRLNEFFPQSEIDNIGTVFRNKEKKSYLILYDDRIQFTSFDVLTITEFNDVVKDCIDIVIQILDIPTLECRIQYYVWGSFKSGKPFFRSLMSNSRKLSELGEIEPEMAGFAVKGKLIYEIMFIRKERGLGFSFRFNEPLKNITTDLPILLNDIFEIIEERNIPSLLKATKSRG